MPSTPATCPGPGAKQRSCANAAEWNVRAGTPRRASAASRAPSLPQPCRVNVTARISVGANVPVATWFAIRRVIVVVFPEPAPARMHTGPRTVSTARRCSALRSAKISSTIHPASVEALFTRQSPRMVMIKATRQPPGAATDSAAQQPVAVIGAALDLGQDRRGVDMGPSAIRYAGLDRRFRSWADVRRLATCPHRSPRRSRKATRPSRFLDQIKTTCAEVARLVRKAARRRAPAARARRRPLDSLGHARGPAARRPRRRPVAGRTRRSQHACKRARPATCTGWCSPPRSGSPGHSSNTKRGRCRSSIRPVLRLWRAIAGRARARPPAASAPQSSR